MGFIFLTITDTAPKRHYTNDWWHQHRKLVIDVVNNTSGNGMPNPIFMVYFDKMNELVAYDGRSNRWQTGWEKAVQYNKDRWYQIELEKTRTHYVMSIYTASGVLLERGSVRLDQVWHTEPKYPDYLALGDPHENYYQGSVKIRSISITVPPRGVASS